jgi:streptomycin 6-kinase
MPGDRIVVPGPLAASHPTPRGQAWIASIPDQGAGYLRRWDLTLDGPCMHGLASVVQPVRRNDGTPAVLKLPLIDEEQPGEAAALRTWDGDGAVRLLDEDPDTWVLLLERVDGSRDLTSVPDDLEAIGIICDLLRRLHAYQPPPGIPELAEVAEKMVADAPGRAAAFADPTHKTLMARWAAATAEVAAEAGNRLLHWDLHYENVLAATRQPWLAIDPKPLAGDPGFDLLPALHNRWAEMVASGDVGRAIRYRFDFMVDQLGLDRDRAVAWTRARLLQNAIWDAEDGREGIDGTQVRLSEALDR